MKEAPRMAFAHMGIYVTDTAKMEDFYTRVLGFSITDRAKIRGADVVFLSRNPDEHHQIVLVPGRDPAHASTINQISFRVVSRLLSVYFIFIILFRSNGPSHEISKGRNRESAGRNTPGLRQMLG